MIFGWLHRPVAVIAMPAEVVLMSDMLLAANLTWIREFRPKPPEKPVTTWK